MASTYLTRTESNEKEKNLLFLLGLKKILVVQIIQEFFHLI
jgi:hypothetical protein